MALRLPAWTTRATKTNTHGRDTKIFSNYFSLVREGTFLQRSGRSVCRLDCDGYVHIYTYCRLTISYYSQVPFRNWSKYQPVGALSYQTEDLKGYEDRHLLFTSCRDGVSFLRVKLRRYTASQASRTLTAGSTGNINEKLWRLGLTATKKCSKLQRPLIYQYVILVS